MNDKIKTYDIKVYPQVYDSIEDIKENIADDNPDAAQEVAKDILAKIQSLKQFPNRGSNLNNRINRPSKYKYILSYEVYAVLYFVEVDIVHVADVAHMARDFSALFDK